MSSHVTDLLPSRFLNNVGFFFPLIMMLTWMVSVASMVRKLVYEREIQIEEVPGFRLPWETGRGQGSVPASPLPGLPWATWLGPCPGKIP